MKLIINYDLINEIAIANTGINMKRFMAKMELNMGIITAINLITLASSQTTMPNTFISGLINGTIIFGGSELITREFNKEIAETRLRKLASSLGTINIYTDSDLLKEGKLYKTQYKIVRENDKTALQQNKYIMIPTTGNFNANEVSLHQEHNIGSREYILSMGEPKKAYSKSLSSSFAKQIQ